MDRKTGNDALLKGRGLTVKERKASYGKKRKGKILQETFPVHRICQLDTKVSTPLKKNAGARKVRKWKISVEDMMEAISANPQGGARGGEGAGGGETVGTGTSR